ncbi:MAG: hypothetical protein SGCHY_003693, partial [Lobulomycetales sp.]
LASSHIPDPIPGTAVKRAVSETSSVNDEDEDAKKQRMLRRNREAAVKSRAKKKRELEQLEADHEKAFEANVKLKATLSALQDQAGRLRHLRSLHNVDCTCGV